MAFTEDLTGFFDTAQGFAVDATWNGVTPVTVIFDQAYFSDTPGTAGIESSKPVALAIEAEMDGVAQGDTLAIGATTYTVAEVHPDGTGLIALVLEK